MFVEVIKQVALITGKVLHQGTREPVLGRVNINLREGEVVNKLLKDGTFVVSGRPELLFPNLSSQSYQVNLEIRAESPQFQQGFAEVNLAVTIPSGWSFDRPVSKQEPASTSTIVILLPADLVNIGGYVLNAANPENRIANATVEVLQGGTVTNSTTTSANVSDRGRYRFNNISVLAPAQIRCAADNFQTEIRNLFIDFSKSLNEEYFRLIPSS